jgi:hypothetical protein
MTSSMYLSNKQCGKGILRINKRSFYRAKIDKVKVKRFMERKYDQHAS